MIGALRDAWTVPDLRRLHGAWGLALLGGGASTVALLAYAYAYGGPLCVGLYGVARTVPATVLTPALVGLAERIGRERMLRGTTTLRAVLLGGCAIVVAIHGYPIAAIALASASAWLSAAFRPLQAAITPWVARDAEHLTNGYVAGSVVENVATLSGTLLAGVLVIGVGPAGTLGVSAAAMAASAGVLALLHVPAISRIPHGRSLAAVLRDAGGGITELLRVAPPAGVAVLTFAQTLVRAATVVLTVSLSVHLLGLGGGGVAWLTAALAVGGLAGAVPAARVARLNRLGRCFVLGVLGWGVPLVVLAAATQLGVVLASLFAVGIGNAVEDAGLLSLLPRELGGAGVGPAFAALEVVGLLGLAVGSVMTPLLIDIAGVRATAGAVGGVLALLALAHGQRFVRLDRAAPVPDRDLDLLSGLPMFAKLPLAKRQLLGTVLERRNYQNGEVVLREGAAGDTFHVIVSGRATVTVHGAPRPDLGPGAGFGEIALLHDTRRTATVTARGELCTLVLSRHDFLDAVLLVPASATAARAIAGQRLAADGAVSPIGHD